MVRKAGVTLSVESVANTDIDALAMGLIARQKEETGVNFAHCSVCLAAVSIKQARRSVAAGRPVLCRTHGMVVAAKKRTKDERVYLCAVCRAPLVGKRLAYARQAAKRGVNTTCGGEDCLAAVGKARKKESTPLPRKKRRHKAPIPCAVCGEPTAPRESAQARHTGFAAYCPRHKRARKGQV